MCVDIIIPVYNQYERLKFVLEGFSRQETNYHFRIIIVDDGSTDELSYNFKLLCTFDIKYYKLQVNRGRSYARNFGVKQSDASIIIFCDGDRIPDYRFVENHVNSLTGQKMINIGSPFEIYESNLERNIERIWETVEGKNHRARLYPYAKKVDSLYENYEKNKINPLIWLTTYSGNISLHREVCLEFPFDENMNKWGLENLEWGLRMMQAGIKFQRSYSCINYHLAHRRGEGDYDSGIKENYGYLIKKYNNINLIVPLADFISGKISLAEYMEKI